jgi:hypothetical protein
MKEQDLVPQNSPKKSKTNIIIPIAIFTTFVLVTVCSVGGFFLGKSTCSDGNEEEVSRDEEEDSSTDGEDTGDGNSDDCQELSYYQTLPQVSTEEHEETIIYDSYTILYVNSIPAKNKLCSFIIFQGDKDNYNLGYDRVSRVHHFSHSDKVSFYFTQEEKSQLNIVDVFSKEVIETGITIPGPRYDLEYNHFPDLILIYPYIATDLSFDQSSEEFWNQASLELVNMDGEIVLKKDVKDYPLESKFKLGYTMSGQVIDTFFIEVYTGEGEDYKEIDKIDTTEIMLSE